VTERAPFVSVVTPFYNTVTYLDACIKSVLRQTWRRFEYLLVNNCSTDGSADVARAWAARDPRIRLIDQPAFLEQVANYNSALARISPESEYVKIVQADDWLYPECLERMVAVGELDPGVVIVGSYYLSGNSVFFSGIPIDSPLHEGGDICRNQLLGRNFFMGNPTTVLYRAHSVRSRTQFFDPGWFSDGEVCFDLLHDGREREGVDHGGDAGPRLASFAPLYDGAALRSAVSLAGRIPGGRGDGHPTILVAAAQSRGRRSRNGVLRLPQIPPGGGRRNAVAGNAATLGLSFCPRLRASGRARSAA